jgi:hypothetical protein
MPSRIEPEEVVGSTIAPTKTKPLSQFKRLSPQVSLYEPPSDIKASSDSPTTILFCSWMNAASKHVDYYTRSYMRIYPGARIILVTINTVEFLYTSEGRRRKEVSQAVNALLASPYGEEDRLVVHSISNGGAKRFYGVAGAYQACTGKQLPAKAYVMDSSPGIPKFRRDMHALLVPARRLSWFAWIPFYIATLLSVSGVYVVVNWMPRWFWGELVFKPLELINTPTFMPKSCVRGYVYSKEDLAIDWRDVEFHAREAEEKGYRVKKKMIEGAGHAVLFKGKGGESDYWSWVNRLVQSGLGLE